MADYFLAKLIRNLYQSTISNSKNSKEWQHFSIQINRIIKFKFSSDNHLEFLEDIANQVSMNIFTSFTTHSFWNEVRIDNESNNKRINGYLNSIINTSFNELNLGFFVREEKNLVSHLQTNIEELIEAGFIRKNKNNYLELNLGEEKVFLNTDIHIPSFTATNKNGTINSVKIKLFLRDLFENYLENYSIDFSILKEISKKCLNLGNDFNTLEISDDLCDSNEFDNKTNISTEYIYDNPEYLIEVSKISAQLIKNSKSNLTEKSYPKKAKAFYYSARYDLSLQEILENFDEKISIKSISEYIKDFRNSMNMIEADIEKEELKILVIENVCKLLNDEFHYESIY
ncbi:MAG: hypothetical protein M0P71_06165 [Melioribacteraceae bacterium]|nr:hypothetical protein [Melioribacteraceae bacterium]